jgi:hypothetical protein
MPEFVSVLSSRLACRREEKYQRRARGRKAASHPIPPTAAVQGAQKDNRPKQAESRKVTAHAQAGCRPKGGLCSLRPTAKQPSGHSRYQSSTLKGPGATSFSEPVHGRSSALWRPCPERQRIPPPKAPSVFPAEPPHPINARRSQPFVLGHPHVLYSLPGATPTGAQRLAPKPDGKPTPDNFHFVACCLTDAAARTLPPRC